MVRPSCHCWRGHSSPSVNGGLGGDAGIDASRGAGGGIWRGAGPRPGGAAPRRLAPSRHGKPERGAAERGAFGAQQRARHFDGGGREAGRLRHGAVAELVQDVAREFDGLPAFGESAALLPGHDGDFVCRGRNQLRNGDAVAAVS